ncbi:hypothetical protein WMZ97_01305 [Lentibacillus sp. N15]|uniref:hypothetical protein n=1 Tax=Lentibacillus songyuanensis TaxID=3136161 RepID=UPI0031BB274E
MLTKKTLTKGVAASLLTGSVLGMGTLATDAHAQADTETVPHADHQTMNQINSTANKHVIVNGTAAENYLRHRLGMDDNKDLVFSDMGGIQNDKKGSYYEVKLTSKSMQEAGGTGTVNIYKVYLDGTYTSEY